MNNRQMKQFKSIASVTALLSGLSGALCGCNTASHQQQDDIVHIDSGAVTGIPGTNPDVRVYKGIPYAAPPVGDLRWRPPQPVVAWDGVRKADNFSPSCAQAPLRTTSIYYEGSYPTSEDCLYLNVWTAAHSPSERRPVLLWIHDGGLEWGEGSRPTYDGEMLSKKGLVVVTINYRLGVFGKLAHPELSRESERKVSGNYGFLDMVAAIKWTRRNIAGFGGDPDRITLYGESVGGRAVSALSTSPLVKGDIRGAIAGDTIFMGGGTLAEAEKAGAELVKAVGASSIQDLRKMPANDLIAAVSMAQAGGSYEFVIDHWALSEDVMAAEKDGTEDNIPILTGTTANFSAATTELVSAKEYRSASAKGYGKLANQFLALYPGSADAEAAASQYSSANDSAAWVHNAWAEAHARNGRHAYLYVFTHAVPVPSYSSTMNDGWPLQARLGAYHTGEIPYAFDSLAKMNHRSWTPSDYQLADTMSSYWANFVTKGDPNGPGLPPWPAYGAEDKPVMELGDRVEAIPRVLSEAKNKFWTDNFAQSAGKR